MFSLSRGSARSFLMAMCCAVCLAGRPVGAAPDGAAARAALALSSDTYDFGSVNIFDAAKITHSFTVKNKGETPIVLLSARPSCGCTSVVTTLGHSAVQFPVSLQPGQALRLEVTVNLAVLSPGRIEKHVTLYRQGEESPAGTITMVGRVTPCVFSFPQAISFGAATFGDSKSVGVTIAISRRLLGAISPPTFLASSSDVAVDRDESALAEGAPRSSQLPAGEYVFQRYSVTLKPGAPIGAVEGELIPHFSVLKPVGYRAMLGVSVPMTGIVTGEMSADPPSVDFGSVNRGADVRRTVSLKTASASLTGDLRLASTDPGVVAAIEGTDGQSRSSAPPPGLRPPASLTITLGKQAELGPFTAEIRITDRNGQVLRIPVTGVVQDK